jgi:hypothetical protein
MFGRRTLGLSAGTRLRGYAVALIVGLAMSACGGRGGSAATMPNGNRVAILVFLDPGIGAETPADKAAQLNQLADWLGADLVDILRGTGYDASLIASKDVPTDVGRYILHTTITNYDAGNRAARAFVGFGAGAARLETEFELLGPGGKVYVKGVPSAGTSRADWKHVGRKINLETVDTVNARLRSGL